ncbi:TFIIH basal transcription factor complex helicase XPB subunit [Toxoplasma gondii GAB2-2007-GAL-DOM2]|uniref:DNA 3'-5' helicase n=2 Tax=Toxoplasma gondii TaxID=5811 RepID=A0A086KHI1_TOXGO|nr:TFIIH basal transcription factor complex helicase XPB subunit [Toxoplasma gondii GAB2-2007-GAL-DOM2]
MEPGAFPCSGTFSSEARSPFRASSPPAAKRFRRSEPDDEDWEPDTCLYEASQADRESRASRTWPAAQVPRVAPPVALRVREEGMAEKSAGKTKDARPSETAQGGVYGSLPLTADSLSLGVGGFRDFGSKLALKVDHAHRPLWVCPDGTILLETFSAANRQATELLLTMAEPICRGDFVHEFQITIFSLYAGISIGLSCEDMLLNLEKFSKNAIPEDLVVQIQKVASAFGKVKLVLNENKYYIESAEKKELDYLLSNPLIRSSAVAHRRPELAQTPQVPAAASGSSSLLKSLPSPSNDGLYVIANAPTLDASQLAFQVSERDEETDPAGLTGAGKSAEPGDTAPGAVTAVAGHLASPGASGDGDPSETRKRPREEGRETSGAEEARGKAQVPLASPHASASPTGEDGDSAKRKTMSAPTRQVFSFQVSSDRVEEVKRVSVESMHRPLLNEYDFRRDKTNKNLSSLLLKSSTKIRYYQERALRKMFSNGRARSGIIVLPCGAGKTLTGITAACTLRKSVMILTTSAVAVDQWRKQFEEYTTIDSSRLLTLTAETKQTLWPVDEAGVLVSTYTMLAFSGRRSLAAERIMQQIREREWGLLIFDEVQFAPAPAFRRINDLVKSHCRLGLTATLVREDDLIKDLQWLIGPKLFEANWIELQDQGFLARVSCQEVWCPMTADFYREYLRCSHAKQRKLWVCNPTKLMTCEWLLRYHEARGDKILVFSDNVFALLHTAKALNRPFIYGQVSAVERVAILNKFKHESTFNSLFLSKVGDNAIDIPCANVVIQISFNFASRRQEAQRLGRILRAKPQAGDEGENFNAFFYSLISKDTLEMVYADKRQQFIIDQGYAYKVIHSRDLPMQPDKLIYGDPQRQREILTDILASDDNDKTLDDDEDDPSRQVLSAVAGDRGRFFRVNSNLGDGWGGSEECQLESFGESLRGFGDAPHVQPLQGGLGRLAGDGGSAYGARPGGRGGGRSGRSGGADATSMHPLFRGLHGKK